MTAEVLNDWINNHECRKAVETPEHALNLCRTTAHPHGRIPADKNRRLIRSSYVTWLKGVEQVLPESRTSGIMKHAPG
ncbi:hypothetical protein ACFU53_30330 [Streptomyces sp. NPDC057474]|uniref:hypothetical protein n=1 Tax=Streptomyces sp. NPDC057474 TaxID=3346144 RepID=UPI0036BBE56F